MVKISVMSGARGVVLLITVGIVMPVLTIFSAIELTKRTSDNHGVVSEGVIVTGIKSVQATLSANQVSSKALLQWTKQRFASPSNRWGTISAYNRSTTAALYESEFLDRSLSQLQSNDEAAAASSSCAECFAHHQGITFYYPAGATSGLTAVWYSSLTSSPPPTSSSSSSNTAYWMYERSDLTSALSLQSTVLQSEDGAATVTETASTSSNANSVSGMDATVASLSDTTAASTSGVVSVHSRADAQFTSTWRGVRHTYGAIIDTVFVSASTETNLQPILDAMYRSRVENIPTDEISKLMVAVWDPTLNHVYAIKTASTSGQQAVCESTDYTPNPQQIVSCAEINRDTLGDSLIRNAAMSKLQASFLASPDEEHEAEGGDGVHFHAQPLFPSSYTSLTGIEPSEVERRLIMVMAEPEEAVDAAVIAAYPVTVLSYLLLIATFAFWILMGKKHILQDVHSLGEEMEEVMLLEFGQLEKGETMLSGQIFSELYEVRDAFLAMADTMYTMTKYIPIEVVRDMMTVGHLNSRLMVSRVVTIIFADIAGFNTFVESVNSEDLVDLTERYFAVATRTLVAHGCTIDKYMGDCVMGMWGAPLDYGRQGFSALCAAIHLVASCRRLRSLFQSHKADIQLRIGINKGPAALGNIGSEERIAYTALGDTVNIAARLKGLNRFYATNIIVSDSVIEDVNPTHRPLFGYRRIGLVRVKGRTEPTAIWNPLGIRTEILGRLKQKLAREAKVKQKKEKDAQRKHAAKLALLGKQKKAASSSGRSGVSSVGTTGSSEKQADLSEEEEVMMLQRSHGMTEDAYAVLGTLSKSIELFEDMRFTEAVALLEEVVSKKREACYSLDLDINALNTQKDFWKLLVQHTPPRDAFDPCDNMQTK